MKRALSLKSEASFLYVRRHGTKIYGKFCTVTVMDAATTKVGVSVSKKIGNAVVRNKVKRRIKEIFVAILPRAVKNRHYLVSAKQGIEEAAFDALSKELEQLLIKSRSISEC